MNEPPHTSKQFDLPIEDILPKEQRVAIELAGGKPYCAYCKRWKHKIGSFSQSPGMYSPEAHTSTHTVAMNGTCHAHRECPETIATYCCSLFMLNRL